METAHSSSPWMDRSLSPAQRARRLVAQMTLDEKISQIHMMDVPDHPREVVGIPRLGIPPFKVTNGPLGAGPGDTRKVQPATALPAALALAASWDTNLARKFGEVSGKEVVAHGDDLIESPGLNIVRVPQCGRNFEYFGEDPFLSAQMGVAEIRAIQQQGVIAEAKHFAANSQEEHRKSINEVIDERTLHEIYLPAFKAAVEDANVGAVMAAYPSVNGAFCCRNPQLLKNILRGDWGFRGFVQSDYTATTNAVACARAGLDLAMRPDHYSDEVKQAVADHQILESEVDAMVERRFEQMFQYGMFDQPRTPQAIPAKKDGAIARSIAEQCAVLLKNNGNALPLKAGAIHSIAVIGPYAGAAVTGGGGSSRVKPLYTVTPVAGIKGHVHSNVIVTYNDGKDPAAAAAAAKSAEVALVMVGNRDGEGHDRPNLSLPDGQDALISAVAAVNPKTIVILKTGGAVLMPWLDQVSSVLEVWYPGEEDGNVVADLLFGMVDPSGKLPVTFPRAESEVPAFTTQQYPGLNDNAVYSEKLDVGYRWYDRENVKPLFPFGFGLSYTTFSLSELDVSPITKDGKVRVSLDVVNTGPCAGAEVVQVYVAYPSDAGEPPRQLKGFAKVKLKPGQKQHVSISLSRNAFSIWNTKAHRWQLVPGKCLVQVGTSSRDLPLVSSVTIPAELNSKYVEK